MVSVKTIGHKIDFLGNCFVESTEYFIIFIRLFIFIPIIKIKIYEKLFLVLENFLSIWLGHST